MYREQLVYYGVIAYGKILIAEFTDKEEQIFNQLVEWLSNTLCTAPVFLSKKCNDLDVNYFTRTVTDNKGNKIHLTSKELTYYISFPATKDRSLPKSRYMKKYGDMTMHQTQAICPRSSES